MNKPVKSSADINDIKLKVSENGERETSPDFNMVALPDQVDEQETKGKQSNVSTLNIGDSTIRRSANIAEKRRSEQEFLQAYNKRQLFIRARFVTIAAIIIGLTFTAFSSFCVNHKKIAWSMSELGDIAGCALLGQRDAAYHKIAVASFNDRKGAEQILNSRTKIIDGAIAKIEKDGQSAIFTRLGAEMLLLMNNHRAEGLKYGDKLIEKYPNLPSNFCWRADVDFTNIDFTNAISEYKKFGDILERSPNEVQRSWLVELPKAIWCCIDAGRMADANKFIELYHRYGGSENAVWALRSQLLLSYYDQLDIPDLKRTDLWNVQLKRKASSLLDQANKIAQRISYHFDYDDGEYDVGLTKAGLFFKIGVESGNHAYATSYIDRMRFMSDNLGCLRAQLELSRANYAEALSAARESASSRFISGDADAEFYLAKSLQRTDNTDESIRVADRGLQNYVEPEPLTRRYYLPLLLVKAQAFYDRANYSEAIRIANLVQERNPYMLEADLIKLNSFEKLHDKDKVASERKAILEKLDEQLNWKDDHQ